MKIRSGFVSNSSSSSFVLIVSDKAFNDVYKTLSPFKKDLISWVSVRSNIDGTNVRVIEGCSGENGDSTDSYKIGDGNTNYEKGTDPSEEDNYTETLDEIVGELRKRGNHYYNHQYS